MRSKSEEQSYGRLLNAKAARPTKSLVLLGASGSIGTTTIAFLENREDIDIAGFSVHSSVETLRKILHSGKKIKRVAISSPEVYDQTIQALRGEFSDVRFFRGELGLIELIEECAAAGADTVLTAVVGACGVEATMAALKLNLKIALANKETLVTAGPAIESFLNKKGESDEDRPVILPVDSEHNAVFQLLNPIREDHVARVILTASGGPFRDLSPDALRHVALEDVLRHPTWSMGPKITVDSAGMINKGLEIIEAHFLFSVPYEKIDVLIHRQSLVHGMIQTGDGGYLLCASQPDMVFPIAHSLYFPDPVPGLHDVATLPSAWTPIEFEEVSADRYPGFEICRQAARTGGTAPALFNAANEVAVELFLRKRIGFMDIPRLIEIVLSQVAVEYGTEMELFLEADRRARSAAEECKDLLIK